MSITVGELMEYLSEFDKDLEVRFAIQPNWPMEYSIDKVVCVDPSDLHKDQRNEIESTIDEELAEGTLDPDQMQARHNELEEEYRQSNSRDAEGGVVYLSGSCQMGYLPGVASEKLGWQ